MIKCDNCGIDFIHTNDGVAIMQGTKVVAALCATCVSGVKKAKIVLTRNNEGVFTYAQYNALEMEKKAFGKRA